MTETREHFSAEQKMAILYRHLLEQVLVSDLCDEQSIHPTLFYRWQKQWFENGAKLRAIRLSSRTPAGSLGRGIRPRPKGRGLTTRSPPRTPAHGRLVSEYL